MISTRRSLNFTAPLVLEPPSHCGVPPIALVQGRHLIGRSDDCDIHLDFDGIASRHAIVLVGENRTIVKSMDSRTWVNDSPIAEMALRSGDRLSIGPVTFRVRSATKDEIKVFDPATVEVGAHIHRVDLPVADVRESLQTSMDSTAGSDKGDERTSNTDAVLAVIEVTPLSSDAIDTHVDRSDVSEPSAADKSQKAANVSLDDRLGEIQQRLAELELGAAPVGHHIEPLAADTNPWARSLQSREQDLLRRVEQVAIETEHLQERTAQLAVRESHLDARQQQLIIESQRIADIAESTRRSLAEEHQQRLAIWKEWEVAYQRMAADVTSQLEVVNQQRTTLQAEADRLSLTRTELQRERVIHEQNRKDYGADQAMLASERTEVLSLKSRLEAQRQQFDLEVTEHRRQVDAAKRELDISRAELNTSLEQLERERQLLLADRSEQIRRVEQDNERRASYYSDLEEERQRLRTEREEFALLQVGFEQRQRTFERELAERDSAQRDATRISRERDELMDRCQQLEAALATQGRGRLAAPCEETAVTVSEQSMQVQPVQCEAAQPIHPNVNKADQVQEPTADAPAAVKVELQRYDTFDPWKVPVEPLAPANAVESSTAIPLPPLPQFDASEMESRVESDCRADLLTFESAFAKVAEQPPATAEFNPSLADSAASKSEDVPRMDDQNIWGDLPAFEGVGAELPVAFRPSTDLSSSPMGIDPWGSFVPSPTKSEAPSAPPVSDQLSRGTAVQAERKPATSETREAAGSLTPHIDITADGNLSADETLAVVNRQFGVPVAEVVSTPTADALPSWWVESAKPQNANLEEPFKVEQPNWVAEALKSEPTEPSHSTAIAADAADDLRSKLAMLFDLPTVPADATSSADDNLQTANEESSTLVDDTSTKVEEVQAESDSSVQDSVEEFMARLLARNRGEEPSPPVATKVKAPAAKAKVEDSVPLSLAAEQDRSHLMAEPKHKQDKQAVRENLQSFRKVAHLSARSALARHSLQQLRNATIAKGILLGASTIALTWFLTRPLFGADFQMWKAGACGLASILSGVEFRRSWSQLFKPITAHTPASTVAPVPKEVTASDAAMEVIVEAPATTELPAEDAPNA